MAGQHPALGYAVAHATRWTAVDLSHPASPMATPPRRVCVFFNVKLNARNSELAPSGATPAAMFFFKCYFKSAGSFHSTHRKRQR